MSHTTLRLRITRRITFSIILLSLVSFGLIQCKKSLNASEKVSQPEPSTEVFDSEKRDLLEIKKKAKELTNLLKKVDIEKLDLEKVVAENGSIDIHDTRSKAYLKQVLHTLKTLGIYIQNALMFLVDKNDKILSIKFLIASFIVISPFLYFYTQYLDQNFIRRSLARIEPQIVKLVDILANIVTKFTSIVRLKMQEKELGNNISTGWKNPIASLKVWGIYLGGKVSKWTLKAVGILLLLYLKGKIAKK